MVSSLLKTYLLVSWVDSSQYIGLIHLGFNPYVPMCILFHWRPFFAPHIIHLQFLNKTTISTHKSPSFIIFIGYINPQFSWFNHHFCWLKSLNKRLEAPPTAIRHGTTPRWLQSARRVPRAPYWCCVTPRSSPGWSSAGCNKNVLIILYIWWDHIIFLWYVYIYIKNIYTNIHTHIYMMGNSDKHFTNKICEFPITPWCELARIKGN